MSQHMRPLRIKLNICLSFKAKIHVAVNVTSREIFIWIWSSLIWVATATIGLNTIIVVRMNQQDGKNFVSVSNGMVMKLPELQAQDNY